MTYDASPLATIPPDLTPLPSGDFALPLMLARSPTTCFNDSTQAQAWNCNQVFAQLQLNINQLSSTPSTSQYAMSLSYNSSFTMDNYEYSYGMQPPKVDDVKMLLVTDINEPSRGPAWAFEVAYNKTVIIPENLFPAPSSSSSSKSKRRGGPPPPPDGISFPGVGGGDFKRKGLAQSGDKPWICHWDGTILEVFVYPNQNNSQPSIIYSGSSSASSTSSGSITAAVAAVTSTSATSDATSTASTTASSEWEFTDHKNAYVTTRHDRRQVTSSTATPTTETSATGTASSSGVFDTSMPKPSDFMVPFFPRVVKMEERRLSGEPSVQPYCRQYQINGNGVAATPIKDSNGKFIEVQIVELEPDGNSEHQRKENQKGRYVVRRDIDNFLNHGVAARNSDSDMSDCGCMWWAT